MKINFAKLADFSAVKNSVAVLVLTEEQTKKSNLKPVKFAKDNFEFTGKNNSYIPSSWDNRNLINVVFTKNFKGTWDVGFKWRFLGGAPYTPYDLTSSSLISSWNVNGKPVFNYNEYNSKRSKIYQQLDVRLDKQFFFKKWSMDIYMDIQNITMSKATGQDNYILQTDNNGAPLVDPLDNSRYLLKSISNQSSVIVPSIGLIIEL